MRSLRWAALLLCVFMLVAAQPSASAMTSSKGRARVEEQGYLEPAYGVAYPSYNMVFCQTGCLIFDVLPRERRVSLTAKDVVGPEVALAIFFWDKGDHYERHDHCTTTSKPLRLPRWATALWVEVLIGPCADGTPAAATTGTVTATFTR